MRKVQDSLKNKNTFIGELLKNKTLYLMMVPGILLLAIFNYFPMIGIIMAFKDGMSTRGYFSGDWVGFKNFEFFFKSNDALRITFNTLYMNGLFIVVRLVAAVSIALLLNELRSRKAIKLYQSTMLLPHFLSWVVVGFVTYAFLNIDYGFINRFLGIFGVAPKEWYSEPGYWPGILTVVELIKTTGYYSILYYAGIVGISQEIYEAARVDGASRMAIIRKITLPMLKPLIVTMILMQIGKIFFADFGLFYYVPRETGALFSKTDVIDTYVYRALRVLGNSGMSAAVGLFQSVAGFIVVLISNMLVKKFDSENALF